MERILGIDYGKKRIGLAISDPLGIFATGLETLEIASEKRLIAALVQIIREYGIVRVVVGLPLRTTGEPGPIGDVVKQFADKLAQITGLPVTLEDERYTSVIAQQSLQAQGIKPSRNKHLVDKTAAALILQQYLDKQQASRSSHNDPVLPE